MFVGICRLTFRLHGVASLKGKRQMMRRIIERTRSRFNVSAAEVADNDVHKRGVVGISVIGNDRAHVDGMMSTVIRFIDRLGVAPVSGIETEVISLSGEIGDGVPRSIDDWRDADLFDADGAEETDAEEDLW